MTLVPIEHEHRLKSAAEAEAFFRARHFLGRASVGVRGHHTTDPARIERLVNAIEPKRDHTISFENGTLNMAALEKLADKRFQYLDIATAKAVYRSWPWMPRTWVYPNASDAQTITFDESNGGIPAALRKFQELTDRDLRQGFINGVRDETKPCLIEFLHAVGATVHVVLHIGIAPARELAELYAGEEFDWGDDGLQVDFPEGRIHGFLVTPNVGPEYEAAWQKEVTKTLAKAKLL